MGMNYVISMVSSHLRRAHITNEFSKRNIDFTFFDAVSKENRLAEYTSELLPNLAFTDLTEGEKGCLLSHLTLWKFCVEESLPYLTIFEDDVLLSKNASLFLNNLNWLSERLPENKSFILRLETFLMPVTKEKSAISPYQGHHFDILHDVHFGTAGYIISNQAAKLLLEYCYQAPAEEITAIDHWVFKNPLFATGQLVIYQQNPAICIQEQQYNMENSRLTSDLRNDRRIRDKSKQPKKTLLMRINKVGYNIKRIVTGEKWRKSSMNFKKDNIIPFHEF